MDYRNTIRLFYDYVVPSYKRMPIVMRKGRNLKLWDTRGRMYLDFFSGYVVSGVGHCNKRVVDAVKKQTEKLIQVPNCFYNEHQGLLAEKIIKHAFPGKVFFSNSGAEAVEGAIKLARYFGDPERYEIITMEKSFHGRTMGAMTATGQPNFHKGVGPLVPGFKTVPLNDIGRLRSAVNEKTVAIMCEPIQGEGGINMADVSFLREMRRLSDERNMLLIFDEVQTGMGRTGKMFCFQHFGVQPDVMTLAKSLGGGLPIGALVVASKFADVLKPGMHATTFGGGPVVCAAAVAVFESLEKDGLLRQCFLMGAYMRRKLEELKKRHSIVKEIRGLGLLLAMELTVPSYPVYEKCTERGLLINSTKESILRFAPPLSVREKDVDKAVHILDEALQSVT